MPIPAIKPNNILRLLYQNKCKVKKLYELYSLKFPRHKYLWKGLVKKEAGQLKILKDLSIEFAGETDILKINECAGQIINYIENYVNQELELIKVNRITSRQALTTALRLEQSMIEKKSSDMLMPLSARLELTLRRISQSCSRHVNILTRALNKASY